MIRTIDLFAGSGGFTYGLHSASPKFTTILANDILSSSKEIYELNFPKVKFIQDDIANINKLPKADIITAGFSCQPFSICGKRLGFKDERSKALWKMLELVEKSKPRFLLLENVKNILTHDKGKTLKTIIASIEKIGYKVKYHLYNTLDFGIPQHRERVYFLCFKDKNDYDAYEFPIIKKKINTNIFEEKVNEKYYYDERFKVWDKIKESVKEKGYFYQYRRTYVRKSKKGISFCETQNMGTGGHNVALILDDVGIRKLTPRECFNLQEFPKSYKLIGKDNELYCLAGNAISVCIVKEIGKSILKLINKEE